MGKKEFIQKLEEFLLEHMRMSDAVIHLKYYREYIDNEISRGRSEKEVIDSLGSPRLIAKNIVMNGEMANKYSNVGQDEDTDDLRKNWNKSEEKASNERYSFSINGKPIGKIWTNIIIALIALTIIFIVIGIIWLIIKLVLPVLVVAIILYFVIRSIMKNSK